MDNGLRIDFKDMARVVGETWRTLTAREKAPYEADARKESAQYEQERRKYEEKHKVWADLHHKAKASGRSLSSQAHRSRDSWNSVRAANVCICILNCQTAMCADCIKLNVTAVMSLWFMFLPDVGLIKVENGAMPAPSTTVKAAAAEAAAVDDDSSGTSLKPAAKAVNADTAKKVR